MAQLSFLSIAFDKFFHYAATIFGIKSETHPETLGDIFCKDFLSKSLKVLAHFFIMKSSTLFFPMWFRAFKTITFVFRGGARIVALT
jgi:hypothetical protein